MTKTHIVKLNGFQCLKASINDNFKIYAGLLVPKSQKYTQVRRKGVYLMESWLEGEFDKV